MVAEASESPEAGGAERGGCDPVPPAGRSVFWFVAALVVVGGVTPIVLYWLLFGRIATVTPQQAKVLLRGAGRSAVLVDVRPAASFATGHIDGAVNWPLDQVRAVDGVSDLPADLQQRTLLLVCDVGTASVGAAAHLQAVGAGRAFHVRGGIQEWIRSAAQACPPPPPGTPPWPPRSDTPRGEPFDRWQIGPDQIVELPFRQSPPVEQAAAVVAFFVVKPAYTLLALLIVVLLWKQSAPDLAALRWGMLFFFLGENACAANYFLFRETSYWFEYLHCLGMLLCFSFMTFAISEGLDGRLLHVTHPHRRCAALGLCGVCIKHQNVPCGLQRTFYLIIPALIAVSLMLPLADWQDNAYNTWVFGQLYNYAHLRVYQQFENWYCGAAAIGLLTISLGILAVRGHSGMIWAKITLAGGVGTLGFGMFRMLLGGAYDQHRVWYLVWEEGTEFLFILGILGVLMIFRRGLAVTLPCVSLASSSFRENSHSPQATRSSL